MITAIDSSVLLDLLVDDPAHSDTALGALREARRRGRLVVCPVVWAEVRALFESDEEMEALSDSGLFFDPFDSETAELAGSMWQDYRRRGGKRNRLLADFLIAAHALVRADALLTRDRGFTRRYFRELEVITPS